MTTKVLIIEDESAALRNLREVMSETGWDFVIAGETDSIADSVAWLRSHPMPDVVFMDIHLADGSAFEIFRHTTIDCPIIFTTAYDEYALKAFDVNGIAYLLKPISADALRKALDKLERLGMGCRRQMPALEDIMRALRNDRRGKSHFLIPAGGDRLIPLSAESIMYFCIRDGAVRAVDSDLKEYTFQQSLDELSEVLDPREFFRANRQYIIAKKAVRDISLWFNGRLIVNMKIRMPERIIISKARASEFKEWF